MKLLNLLIVINSISSQQRDLRGFWQIAGSFLIKSTSTISSLFIGPEVLSSAFDKAKLFPGNFSKNSNPHDLCIALPAFPSRTNKKMHSILVTPRLVKKT